MGVRKDSVQIELSVEAAQAKAELDNLQRKSKLVSDELKTMVKGTKEYADSQKELKQVNARMAEIRKELGVTGLSYNQLNTLSSQLNRELRGLTPGTAQFIDKSKELSQVDARLNEVRKQIKGIEEELKPAGNGFSDLLKKGAAIGGIALGAEALVQGVLSTGRAVFDTTARFEKYEAVLATALGSETAAAQVMGQIQEQAAKTPFSVDELTASYIKYVNRGIIPTMGQLTKLGDVAASQGKSFDQLTEAVLDAGTGEFERLKEFGIQASKSGDQVELSFKGVQKTVANTPDAITEALVAFGEVKGVMGSTAAVSATLEGQVSNLGDTADQTAQVWGNGLKPVFVAIISTFVFFLGILKETPGFIKENRFLFLALGIAVLSLNGANIAAAASTLYFAAVERGRALATAASATAQRLLNAAMTANPIGLVVTAVALLVAGFLALYDKSEKVRIAFAGFAAAALQVFKVIKDSALQQLGGVGNIIAGIFTGDFSRIKAGLTGLGDSLATVYNGIGKKTADAFAQGSAERQKSEDAARIEREKKQAEVRIENAAAEAKKKADKERAADLAGLKEREANIKAALALVAAGSAEELKLKKREVAVKRDIELLDEKKSAADKRVIRAEAIGEIRKLDADYSKKQQAEAEKRAKEELDIQKRTDALKNGLIADEFERRIAQLQAQAEQEKATVKGTAEQMAAQRLLIEQQLGQAVAAERVKQANAQADELADIEKRKLALEKEEYVRHAGELRLAAAAELRKVQGQDANSAEVRRLIQAKLQQDLLALEKERVDKQAEVAARIVAIDDDIYQKRRERARNAARERNPLSAKPDDEEQQDQTDALDQEKLKVLSDDSLSPEEQLAKIRQLEERKDEIFAFFAKKREDREKDLADTVYNTAAAGIQILADFSKISSDKELARVDKEKNRKLATLDAEFKAGRISKDQYEKDKTKIEASANQETRRIKKDAAETEKKAQVAQAIIAGVLAVIKAGGLTPMGIATGIFNAIAVGKIIATPIPEFAKGGVFGGPRKFATGGTFDPRGGVPDRGQLHSGGGIRMVDGASGEHLGEMERGEPYMILSRTTYANNRGIIDSLLDTSMNKGGAPIGKYETGGVFTAGGSSGAPTGGNTGGDDAGRELVQEVRALRSDVRNLQFQVTAVIGDEQIRELSGRQADFVAQEAQATA